jgi:hypothetical protein
MKRGLIWFGGLIVWLCGIPLLVRLDETRAGRLLIVACAAEFCLWLWLDARAFCREQRARLNEILRRPR